MTLKKTILAAYDHQDYPFARLLNKLNRQKEYPLITTIFNLDRVDFSEHRLTARNTD